VDEEFDEGVDETFDMTVYTTHVHTSRDRENKVLTNLQKKESKRNKRHLRDLA